MDLDFTITGSDELARALEAAAERFADVVPGPLYRAAEYILADSKENYVPVDDSALKQSGQVHLPEISADGVTVAIGYGDTAAPYALAVHEHLSEHSPRSWQVAEAKGSGVHFNIGGPKYLETPMLQAADKLPGQLAEEIWSEIEKPNP